MSRASFPLVVLALAGTVAAGLRHGVVASPSEPGQTLRFRRNLLDNGGFERADRGVPVGWRWDPWRAKGTCTIDRTVAHSGRCSVKITNAAAEAPHVYSQLITTAEVVPGSTYTLSAWVRSADPGKMWIGGGRDWQLRGYFKPTGGRWRRESLTFKAGPQERLFHVRILTESPTGGVWIDDVQLEAGGKATEFEHVPGVAPGKPVFDIHPIALPENLLPNASFEAVEGANPRHWRWNRRNTDATMTIDTSVAHSGKRSLRFTHATPFGSHVYGMLSLAGGVDLKANTTYTFSCYVRGKRLGLAWLGGTNGWRIRMRFPKTTAGRWVRVELPFTTSQAEAASPVLIATESPTEPFWVDDVQLVEAAGAAPFVSPGLKTSPQMHVEFPTPPAVLHRGRVVTGVWNAGRFPRDKYLFVGRELWAKGWLHLPVDLAGCVLSARVADGAGKTLVEQTRTGAMKAGTYRLSLGCSIKDVMAFDIDLRVAFQGRLPAAARGDPSVRIEARNRRKLIFADLIEARLVETAVLRDLLARYVALDRQAGRDPAYRLATLTVLRNFIDFAREDLQHGELARAYDASLRMNEMANRAMFRKFPPVPRYQTAAKGRSFRLAGGDQLGTVRWPNGRVEADRPLQFVGVGHFGQVKRDIERLSGYGCNIIQIEFGPNSVVVGDGQISTKVIEEYLKLFDRAAKANVAVNLLVSPHYFPAWALQKWPHLKDAGGGFLKFDVHAPQARAVLEKFLRTVIPRIRHHPALHSICLTNEPLFVDGRKSRFVRAMWQEWLKKQHGTIHALNRRWGTKHAGFDAVAIPPPGFQPGGSVYDYVRFNREAFAAFHAWMAGIIRELAPGLPVHAKIMICANFHRHVHGPWSVSPERFAELSDLNGNDAWKFYQPTGEWASSWVGENMGYDFQRSLADKCVFNSENHLIPDRTFEAVPPEHIRNVFWQGAIHGQGATTTWVWERTYSYTADTAGSILHRPACVEAMGHAGLDLMRLAKEVAAFQKLRPQIALLWSPASVVAGRDHIMLTQRMYEGLNFQGVRIGFVTERQLQACAKAGKLPRPLERVKVIVAAGATHTPDATLAALRKFREGGGQVLCVGECFTRDEYGRRRAAAARAKYAGNTAGQASRATHRIGPPLSSRAAFDFFRRRIAKWPIERAVRLVTPEGGAVWGVEYLSARCGDRLLVNLANYLRPPQRVRLAVDGVKAFRGRDLLSGRAVGETFQLPSLAPMLVEVLPDSSRRSVPQPDRK